MPAKPGPSTSKSFRGIIWYDDLGHWRSLKAKLIAAGDRPILDFRKNDYLSAREAQWRQSVQSFTRALEVIRETRR